LFLARGMAAWVNALSALAPLPMEEPPPSQAAPGRSVALGSEITMVLAQMVLGCFEEAAA